MHILIISYDFCLEAGGIQNTSYLLADELSKMAKITCYMPAESHQMSCENVNVVRSKYSQWVMQKISPCIIGELLSIHKEHKIDYILGTTYFICQNVLFLKWMKGIPYGIMTHGNEVMPFENNFRLILSKFKRKVILKNASHIFSNSHYTKDLVRRIAVLNNVTIVYPPIRETPMNSCENYKNHLIFSVGRIVERKGFQNVIKALPDIIKRYPDIKYIIAGEGEFRGELQLLTHDLNLDKNVFFVGKITEDEKKKYLIDCGLFVMPSYSIPSQKQVEGFGLVYLEANVYGKFVIGSHTGGVPDAIIDGKTGFIVEENNIDEITRCVTEFYDSDFNYSPNDCFQKAANHHVSKIARNYYNEIKSCINNQ